MAEEGKENQNDGSWWGSWINSAKNKTSTVFEAVKKDLDELSTAVRTEASNVGAAIESTLKLNEETSPVGTMKKSLSSFFGQVTEALIPSLEDDEVETVLITRDGAITLTGFQKHLADLQYDDKTYLEEPQKELEDKYKLWMEVIEQDQFTQDRLAKHLASSEILNEKYLSLVPEKIPHMEFWQRYLFKRALLEDALANAEIAERRAKNEINSTKPISPRRNIIQTEQPKLTCKEDEINDELVNTDEHSDKGKEAQEEQNQQQVEQKQSNSQTPSTPQSDIENLEKELTDDNINWDNEEIPNNVELSEEEQIRLLEQYELEIQEREKKRNENNVNNKGKKNNNNNAKSTTPSSSTTTTPTMVKKNSKNNTKSSVNQQQRQLQKRQQSQQQKSNKISTNNSKNNDSSNLILQKDHFNNKDETTSSTSDESWEKDFDLND